MNDRQVRVIEQFSIDPQTVSAFIPISAGHSGASVWRVDRHGDTSLALRQWPRDFPASRVDAINAILRDARKQGLEFLPDPFPSQDGSLVSTLESCAWDLCTWQPGTPTDRPDSIQWQAAMDTLARWHRIGELLDDLRIRRLAPDAFPRWHASRSGARFDSPAIARRRKCWRDLASIVDMNLSSTDDPLQLVPRTRWVVRKARSWIRETLDRSATCRIPMKLCLGDGHAEHFLFEGGNVTGLIDFGALTIDGEAVDLGRYLSSIRTTENIDVVLDFYEKQRPLDKESRAVAKCVARVSSVLACLNWLNWLVVERREFVERRRAYARWEKMIELAEQTERA